MTPLEERNAKLAERLIKNLNRRNMEAFYCPTGKEAVKKVSELIADGSTVTWGGTATVRDLGIPDILTYQCPAFRHQYTLQDRRNLP